MRYEYDVEADAIYVSLRNQPYVYGEDLDDARRIDYGSDRAPIGVELLGVSKGVNVEGLPYAFKISELLQNKGISVYYQMKQRSYYTSGDLSILLEVDLPSSSTGYSKGDVECIKEKVTA